MLIKIIKNSFLIFLLSTILFANNVEEKQKEYRNSNIDKPSTSYKTYEDAVESEKTKDWNNQNWKKHLENNGVFDTGLIGNSQNNMTPNQGSEIIYSGNPNFLSTSAIREQESLKDNKSLFGYSNEVEKSILDGNNQRYSNPINLEQSTKCYIAREMPVRFRCDKTGLIYGGGINSSGMEAKQICESECYEQYACVNVTPTNSQQLKINVEDNIELIADKKEVIYEKDIINGLKIDNIIFNAEGTKDKLYVDIIAITSDDKEKIINRKILIKKDKQNNLKINMYGKRLIIKLYGDKIGTTGALKDVSINFKKENKFICPTTQDLTGKNPGEFAYLCPSGKIKTFVTGGGTYQICEDYGVIGDNEDGTFSTQDGCANVCKDPFSCSLDTTSVSTNSLTNFREGCIEGQPNCKIETCRNLRISQGQIINENVFYANFESIPTVVSGAVLSGAERPKILLDEDIEFQKRSEEEWKDGAYQDMIHRGSYRVTAYKLNENTENSNGYNLGIFSNSFDGTSQGSAVRTLYWAFKPKAFDVDNEKTYYFYAVIEVFIDNLKYDQYGNTMRTKDRIFYVKTSSDDYFKPFAIKENYMQKASDGINDSEVLTSNWEYKYFNTTQNKWYLHNPSTKLEYFKSEKIKMNNPFQRLPIVSNYNTFMYKLPGVIRKILKQGYLDIPIYSGEFDGTGQVITTMKLYVDYTNSLNYTYQDVIEKIDSGDWKPIYNNSSSGSTPNSVVSDTQRATDSLNYHTNQNKKGKDEIEIFTYGKESNKTAFTRIKPKEEDIGKKAFIYIFAQ
ncbi:hypothetical protein ACNSOL_12045 (plasmid) [Aliarcobacter lanthieri]|uniref:hypothetical protein n=1 Tax=Aliarcobacter lanthieri TaxID=1355374 RepID=UPI003AAC7A4D